MTKRRDFMTKDRPQRRGTPKAMRHLQHARPPTRLRSSEEPSSKPDISKACSGLTGARNEYSGTCHWQRGGNLQCSRRKHVKARCTNAKESSVLTHRSEHLRPLPAFPRPLSALCDPHPRHPQTPCEKRNGFCNGFLNVLICGYQKSTAVFTVIFTAVFTAGFNCGFHCGFSLRFSLRFFHCGFHSVFIRRWHGFLSLSFGSGFLSLISAMDFAPELRCPQ